MWYCLFVCLFVFFFAVFSFVVVDVAFCFYGGEGEFSIYSMDICAVVNLISLGVDCFQGILHYQIDNEGLSWSYIFGQLERNRHALNIVDYSISQTTLEQVILLAVLLYFPL